MTAGLLDLLLVIVLVAYAVGGWRQGLLTSLLSIVGFIAGGALGFWIMPLVLDAWPSTAPDPRLSAVVAVVAVFVLASVGQALGVAMGSPLRKALHGKVSRWVDSLFGAVVVVATTAVFMWLLAGLLRPATPPAFAKALGQSTVLKVIDTVVPPQTATVVARVQSALDEGGFPRVFDGLRAEPITPVAPPPTGVAATAPIKAAAGSVVKITGASMACQQSQEGSGWVLANRRVVTNAHVVAGLTQVSVRVGGKGPAYLGSVVVFDPERDLAVIDVPDLTARPLVRGGVAASGDVAAVAGFPLDGPYSVAPARVRTQLTARGADIYGQPGVDRQIYSLYATVKPGNSGGPLLDDQGRVIGVVFARSMDDAHTGYALTLEEAQPVLDLGLRASAPVATGACIKAGS